MADVLLTSFKQCTTETLVDYIKNRIAMKKQDLKTFMLVQLKNGRVGIIVDGYIIFKKDVVRLSSYYNDDLTSVSNTDNDIIKVSESLKATMSPNNWTKEVVIYYLLLEQTHLLGYFSLHYSVFFGQYA